MVNQITSNITQLRNVTDTDASRGSKPVLNGALSKADPKGAAENVSFSANALSLPGEMKKGPPIDTEMVAQLSTEIAAGRYPLNPAKIAEALSAQISLLAD